MGVSPHLKRGGVQAGKRRREAEAVEVFAAEAAVAAVRWMAAEEEVVAVEAKAAAERWLEALFCRWLKEWAEGAEEWAVGRGMSWVVAAVSRVVEAAAGATEAAPCLLEGSPWTAEEASACAGGWQWQAAMVWF